MIPSTVHFSRPGSRGDVVGVHPDDDDRALGLLGLLLGAVELGVAVLLGGEHRLGGGVDRGRRPRSRWRGWACRRRRAPGACPAPRWSGRACSTSRASPGARSRSSTTAGRPSTPTAPSMVLRTSGRRPMPASASPSLRACDGGVAVLLRRGGGVAHLDDLVVGHQLAGQVDDAGADEQQAQAQGQAEGDGGGAEAGEGVPVVADLEGEVGDHEQDGADHRGDEHRRDLALGALLGLGVDVGGAPRVGGQAGVGDRLGLAVRGHVRVVRHGRAVGRVDGVLRRRELSLLTRSPCSSCCGSCARRSRPRRPPARRCRPPRRTGPRRRGPGRRG